MAAPRKIQRSPGWTVVGTVSASEFKQLTRPLIGMLISRPWRGHGSSLLLELGTLTESYHRTGCPMGEAGMMLEWSWRVESPRAIEFGSSSGELKMNRGILSVAEATVEEITLVGRLPEISIQLSGPRWIQSFTSEERQPVWTIFLPDKSWLAVRNGHVFRGKDNRIS